MGDVRGFDDVHLDRNSHYATAPSFSRYCDFDAAWIPPVIFITPLVPMRSQVALYCRFQFGLPVRTVVTLSRDKRHYDCSVLAIFSSILCLSKPVFYHVKGLGHCEVMEIYFLQREIFTEKEVLLATKTKRASSLQMHQEIYEYQTDIIYISTLASFPTVVLHL